MLSDDSFEAYNAICYMAGELRKELFNGYAHITEYGGGKGVNEALALITALNYDQELNSEALNTIYEYDTEEEFNQYCDNINFAYFEYLYKSNVDFKKYMLDEELADFISKVCDEYKEYMDGNQKPIINEINTYFESTADGIDNYIKYYFMISTAHDIYPNDYNTSEAKKLYLENVSSKLFKSFKL